MSYIVKGAKMPQKEGDYDARLHVNRDGTALFYLYKECGGHAAKEIPPHGRLIDADALISQYKGNILTAQTDYAEGLRDAIADIKTAPTIIEAEG